MITIKELANILNLAPSTISMALNDRKGISPEVKIKVKDAAKKYGYLPYIKARETGMYSTGSRVISVVYPQTDITVTETVQSGIDKIIKEHDYHKIRYTIELFDSTVNEKSKEMFIANILENTRTNGIILFSIPLSEVTLANLTKKGINIIFLNTYLKYGKCVYMNNVDAASQAVGKLIDLGHKEVGIVIPDESLGFEWIQKFEGYKKALADRKINLRPEYVFYENDFSSLRTIGYATKALLNRAPEINAIFYGNDILAFGGIKMLKEMGKRIPEDIAIIGMDNMQIGAVLEPSLSSVNMPYQELGKLGAEMLLDTIALGKYGPQAVRVEGHELVLRKSCLKDYNNDPWV